MTFLSYLGIVLASKLHDLNNKLGTFLCILWNTAQDKDYYQFCESLTETTCDGQLYGSIWLGARPQWLKQTLILLLLWRYFADVTEGYNQLTLRKKKESEAAQSCPTLCNPTDCSLPGSSIHGIFQARVLEWVAISFSRRSSQPRDRSQVSCIVGKHFTVWATRELNLS